MALAYLQGFHLGPSVYTITMNRKWYRTSVQMAEIIWWICRCRCRIVRTIEVLPAEFLSHRRPWVRRPHSQGAGHNPQSHLACERSVGSIFVHLWETDTGSSFSRTVQLVQKAKAKNLLSLILCLHSTCWTMFAHESGFATKLLSVEFGLGVQISLWRLDGSAHDWRRCCDHLHQYWVLCGF